MAELALPRLTLRAESMKSLPYRPRYATFISEPPCFFRDRGLRPIRHLSSHRQKTDIFAEWTATATLVNGESYQNRGVHVVNMKWGKITHEDALAVSIALDKQYEAGIKDAKAPKIEN